MKSHRNQKAPYGSKTWEEIIISAVEIIDSYCDYSDIEDE